MFSTKLSGRMVDEIKDIDARIDALRSVAMLELKSKSQASILAAARLTRDMAALAETRAVLENILQENSKEHYGED